MSFDSNESHFMRQAFEDGVKEGVARVRAETATLIANAEARVDAAWQHAAEKIGEASRKRAEEITTLQRACARRARKMRKLQRTIEGSFSWHKIHYAIFESHVLTRVREYFEALDANDAEGAERRLVALRGAWACYRELMAPYWEEHEETIPEPPECPVCRAATPTTHKLDCPQRPGQSFRLYAHDGNPIRVVVP